MKNVQLGSAERFSGLIDSLPVMVCEFLPDSTLISVNQAYCDYFNMERSQLLGRCFLDFLPSEDMAQVRSGYLGLTPEEPEQAHFHKVIKDGKVVWHEWTNRAFFNDEGEPVLFSAVGVDVTRRRLAEKRLASSEAKFRRLVEHSPGIIYSYDLVRGGCYYSRNVKSILGYDVEYLERNGNVWHDSIHPDDLPKVDDAIAGAAEGNEFDLEYRIRTATGEWKWLHDRCMFLRDEDGIRVIDGLAVDITRGKRVQVLRKAKLLLRECGDNHSIEELVDLLLEEVGRLTESPIVFFQFVQQQQKILRQLGVAAHREIVEPCVLEGMHYSVDATGTFAECLSKSVSIIHNSSDELTELLPAGHVPISRELLVPIVQDGDVFAVVGVCNKACDYTNDDLEIVASLANTAADMIQRIMLTRELLASKEKAEAASKAKSEFLANMSHEIRTPLNGIMGMLQLMDGYELDSEFKAYVQQAMNSSRRLTRLLTDILDLSRVEAGKMRLSVQSFDLRELLDEISQLFTPVAQQKGIALSSDLDPALPLSLYGDYTRLLQVLNNLVGNAVKFTECGRVNVAASLLAERDDGEVLIRFSVSDTGIGIPEDFFEELFSAFVQIEGSYARQYQGAGLGLAIVKRLVRLMGGQIDVASEVGVGSTFHVEIPLKAVVDSARESAGDPCVSHALKSLEILLVEDDRVNGLAARKLLEKAGHTVLHVGDGRRALEALRTERFDVVLMDIQLPKMDGVEATKAIRNGEVGDDTKDIPIIVMTGYTMPGDREKFLASGANEYLAKPIEMTDVHELLRKLFEQDG